MFCDETIVKFEAGKGGDGIVSWRRERYIAKGGPDGGDGGKGADVVLQGDANLNTLYEFNLKKMFRAENGVSGGKQNKRGAAGEDLVLRVPLGVKLFDENEKQVADIVRHGQKYVVARGGRGGYGNAHFKSSTRQAPAFAELGEPGEEVTVRMELQMIADVGIIGFPSAGKSTLISRITDAKPKIGNYPFTTLVPNLGVVNMAKFKGAADQSFVVADIPGLIEGAHEGKGLGDKFLKHIKRTAATIHLIDLIDDNFIKNYEIINSELNQFSPDLADSKQFLVFNKIDSISEEEIELKIEEFLEHYPEADGEYYLISAVSGENISGLMFDVYEWVSEQRSLQIEEEDDDVEDEEEYKVFQPHLDDQYTNTVELVGVEKREDRFTGEEYDAQIFEVKGKRLEQIVVMSDYLNDQARERVYDVLYKMGVYKQVQKDGAKVGDIIRIAGKELVFRG